MNIIIVIIAGLLPAILLWLYIWKQDSTKEPLLWLLKAVLYGVLICIPVATIESEIYNLLFETEDGPHTIIGAVIDAFFCAAIPEETFKFLALWYILRHNQYYDEHFDGIVYAVCVGLGFAGIENLLYLFDNFDDWMNVALLRSFMAVPLHYACAILMGYYYSKYHFVDSSNKNAVLIIGVPVLVHGVYDALLMASFVNEVVGGICIIVIIVFLAKLHTHARNKILSLIKRDES